MTPIDFEVCGESYQLLPHTGFASFDLARKVQHFCTNLYSSPRLAGLDSKSDEYALEFLNAFSDEIFELSSSEYRSLVENTLCRVTVTTEGKKNVALGNFEAISAHFGNRYTDMYTVMFKVWILSKFPPFGEAPETQTAGA